MVKNVEHRQPSPTLPGFEHINRYWDPKQNVFSAKIHPGEYYVTNHPELITTVLGSCISACIRDPITKVGGMNHFMLPISKEEEKSADVTGVKSAFRYGNWAMEHLINDILKQGANRKNLEIKVFGGSNLMNQSAQVGKKNIDFIHQYLETEKMPIASEDLGGNAPRKIIYDPVTGKVMVKKLQALQNDTIASRDNAYMNELKNKSVGGDVELF